MATVFDPSGSRVLVKPDPVADKSEGGLYIPDMAKNRPSQGTVVAVGPGSWVNGTFVPIGLKPGDRVLYGKYAGTDITLDGVDYVITTEEDVMGTVRKTGGVDAELPAA